MGLHRVRYWFLAALLSALLALWPGVRAAVRVDNSLRIWFLEGDPALRSYRAFQRLFGNDEVVIVAVRDSARTLLAPANQRRLAALSTALAALPSVQAVLSPAVLRTPAGGLGGTAPLLGAGLDSATLRAALARQPTLRDQLFTPDYRTARLLITLRNLPDFDNQRGAVLAQVRATVGRHFALDKQAWLGGVGVVYAGLNELSQRDFGFFLGIGFGLMFLLLWALYRRGVLVLYALGIVGTATYLTLGLYGALGYRLNLLTVLLPVVIILLGLMDALHVINEMQQLAAPPGEPLATSSPKNLALAALSEMLFPCAATMLTNVAGFLALLSSPMPILRTFGLFSGVGIAWCLVLTFGLGVWLLPLAGIRRIKNYELKIKNEEVGEAAGSGRFSDQPRATRPFLVFNFLIFNSSNSSITARTSAALARLYGWVLGHRRALTLLVGALVLGLAAGLPRLRADTYTLGYFPSNSPVVRSHQALERAWGAYMPLELLVRPRTGLTLHSPEVVQATEALADSLRRRPGVGRVFGFAQLYRAGLEARLGPGRRTQAALGSRGALRLTHERLAAEYPALLAQFASPDGRVGRLTLAGPMLSARQLSAQMAAVRRVAGRVLGPVATVEPAGYQPLYAAITQYVTRSQTSSLGWSLVVVLGLVWALVRSWRLALLTVLPNLFPVLVVLGFMGWAGIALDTATASIAAIVLSLSVDDTVHFMHHYQRQRRALGPAAARLATIRHVGPAIVLTGAILLGGYAFMMLGSLKTVQLFGLLTAVSIVGAMFGELVIFPLVLARFDKE